MADFDWRRCDNEQPPSGLRVLVAWESGEREWGWYDGSMWHWEAVARYADDITPPTWWAYAQMPIRWLYRG